MTTARDDGGPLPERVSELLAHANGNGGSHGGSRSTSPGGGAYNHTGIHTPNESDDDAFDATRLGRTRPRVFPYAKHLPYETETRVQREADIDEMIKHLYIAVKSGDFAPGAVHWTKEIRGALTLKFDLTLRQRISLVKLYYELALAPGLEYSISERFASMFMVLTKRKHYLRPGVDLTLDWRPLWRELKVFVLPSESATQNTYSSKRNVRTLGKLCTFAQLFFDPRDIPEMLEEFLPFFSMSFSEHAFVVLGLLNLMLPTGVPPDPKDEGKELEKAQPQYYLPTLFHLWGVINRSMTIDMRMLDVFGRLARDCLGAEHLQFGPWGLFEEAQSKVIFTAILRLLEIPVGQATTPYSSSVDLGAGMAVVLDRDPRRHPVSHSIARWVVMSLSPKCLEESKGQNSIMHQLEGLLQGIETFFHPSNSGSWTKPLSQLVYYLADFFVMRWNREASGEYSIPQDRRLTPAVRRRFVLCMRDVVFMGIYAKSGTAMNYSLSALQSLSYLEPSLMLPGALQRIYPAMQGLVEVHRTTSSIRALQQLSRIMARTKGWRCHLTTLLGLALPGVDANDLDKTLHSLSFIQGVCYCIPLHDLTKEQPNAPANGDSDMPDGDTDPGLGMGTELAVQWITEQVSRFEHEGPLVEVDYEQELSEADEQAILKSSTAGFAEFLISFLGRVFTLLQNLPDAARVKSGSPEENIVNTLPAAFSPLLAALSPELYDIALEHIAKFITNHVVHQARDAMAFICNALVKINPKKALHRLLPELISSIRTEISENGAGSTRTVGSEILPRDRALVWHVSLLSMCVVHVGGDVLDFQIELFDIAHFMQDHCRGIPLVHVSNFIHHLLLNLTVTYATDYKLFEQDVLDQGLTPKDWGAFTNPRDIKVHWHAPSEKEIDFAIRVFDAQSTRAIRGLQLLCSSDSPVKRDGTGKDWSDEVARNLVLLRLVISGMSSLFRSSDGSVSPNPSGNAAIEVEDDDDIEADASDQDDDKVRRSFTYPTGYPLQVGSAQYERVHGIRREAGEVLHKVHEFLVANQEDDVPCFNSLYTAYRSWFVDIGIERSAHVLDRLTRLLNADIHPFKLSGTRKQYPRPLLIRRANLYHFERLRFNEHPRAASDLDKKLLLDLALSSTSPYTDVRRTAQSAGEQAVKSLVGAKPLIIPPLLDALDVALDKTDHPRIKGALYTLLFGSLAKPIGKNWNYAPKMIKLFIRVIEVDRPSIQKIVGNSSFTIQDMVKAMDRMAILDEAILEAIWPPQSITGHVRGGTVAASPADAEKLIQPTRSKLKRRRAVIEAKKTELASELVESVRTSHWKKASRTAVIVIGLDYRFETIASKDMLELVVKGVIDPHPQLRTMYANALMAICALTQTRALVGHDYKKYLLDEQVDPDEVTLATKRDDPQWTNRYLEQFARPDAEAYIDADYPGWLAWTARIRAFKTGASSIKYDDVEMGIRKQIGSNIDRHWLSTYFGYMKQEPRDSASDRFRMSACMMVSYALDLMADGLAIATFDDFKDLTSAVFGDGSDKHQHRAMSEICGALLTSSQDFEPKVRLKAWEFAFPIIRRIFQDGLTPENISYWSTFTTLLFGGKDPRRAWPLLDWLADFRLDRDTSAAFKESSKITLLQLAISGLGWHFQLHRPIVKNLLEHIDHPYKAVREVMGSTLATIFRSRYHESYRNVCELLEAQRESPIGTRPYQPTEEFSSIVTNVFERLEKWRRERLQGTQTPTPYTQASKTVLLWLDTSLSSSDCTTLVPFFPKGFMQQLLHMMDIKEDPELQSLAYHVFRHLPNIPHLRGEDKAFVENLIEIGRSSTSWHQRLRVLINIQVIYFRLLFIMSAAQARELFDCVCEMLHDPQLEVRLGASTTLSGMVRCSPVSLRESAIEDLKHRFSEMLAKNPLPRRKHGAVAAASSGTSTPTPEQNKLVLTRHAAVLGLGALVQAFPYTSPPPEWLPGVLATAARAAGDPGVVGKSVKTILSDFKKTRQDTWHVDMKAFEPEQLEDLEGVLWKSYFA
ncbi:hypothetical protein K431DRAFT_307719 [Polychaeton citri CBS 116435]|uniref:Proteasome activator subunit 4 n=1 Tax=Polychaeton citri CBS 116435 TaxID=1314669 RepID=A0A9P4UI65_9PEZI|nr:hypothetical protein K431DRAFT_307719 [Polychaeton citri CBS 116435]